MDNLVGSSGHAVHSMSQTRCTDSCASSSPAMTNKASRVRTRVAAAEEEVLTSVMERTAVVWRFEPAGRSFQLYLSGPLTKEQGCSGVGGYRHL